MCTHYTVILTILLSSTPASSTPTPILFWELARFPPVTLSLGPSRRLPVRQLSSQRMLLLLPCSLWPRTPHGATSSIVALSPMAHSRAWTLMPPPSPLAMLLGTSLGCRRNERAGPELCPDARSGVNGPKGKFASGHCPLPSLAARAYYLSPSLWLLALPHGLRASPTH